MNVIFVFVCVAVLAGTAAGQFTALYPPEPLPCAVGQWAFMFRPGTDSSKLVVEFEGGGGCWDASTCSPGGPYKDSVNVQATLNSLNNGNGVHDHSDSRNPFQEWNHLYVPYCSGDIFVGDNQPEWGVEHRGWQHGSAAQAWIAENLDMGNITKLMVTGCSAGGYGAVYWSPVLFRMFTDENSPADLYALFDSSCGIASTDQLEGMSNDLNMTDFLTQGAVPAYNDMDYTFADPESFLEFSSDVLGLQAAEFSNAVVASFTHEKDSVQYFYTTLGRLFYTPQGWADAMRTVFRKGVEKAGDGLIAGYVSRGASHCIIPYSGFYSMQVEGIYLYDWLAAMVNNQPFQTDVDCLHDGSC